MKLLVASSNPKKLHELQVILAPFFKEMLGRGVPIELVSLSDFPAVSEVDEDGLTFEENAVKKALGYAKQTGLLTIAEDSGLSVEALGGKPGVFSARFAGKNRNDLDNCKKVIELIQSIPKEKRSAKFESVVAFAEPTKLIATAYGSVKGLVLTELRGSGGFGYDPMFYYPPFEKTLAEADPYQKNSVSHRRQALEKLQVILYQYFKKN